MQVYWASMFILPKKVVREVNKILKCFFGSVAELKTSEAKVAWDDICIPNNVCVCVCVCV